MDIATLTSFFLWCTIINGALLALGTVMCIVAPDFVYKKHTTWFPMSRETYNVAIYGFLGVFKILFLIFNFTPWLALLIIAS